MACENCTLRSKYDDNPASILARLWKWHTKWCPGWKKYIASLSEEERQKVLEKYAK
ncbi:hypothetical protein KQI84_03355 [bacterium]|nr:hypothetical protein [bacterium]